MKPSSTVLVILGLCITITPFGYAASARPDEMADAREWAAAKFLGVVESRPATAGLLVEANHDPVQKDMRNGRPMRIGDQLFRRGLYCHAVSRVVVQLAEPGRRFTAIVGVDSNDQTSGGRGSVVFSVSVADKEAFRSGVMREGTAAVSVDVDLGGASEFVLEVDDAGDGIACDQADWAEARVTLLGGRTLWLGELPFLNDTHAAWSTEPPFSFVYGGRASAEILGGWKTERSAKPLDSARTQHETTCTDPATGLVVRAVGLEYHDFPVIEWTLYFKNTGNVDTPMLSEILPLDTSFSRSQHAEFTLHHYTGSPCTARDYEPFATRLGPKAEKRIAAAGGRPTNSDLPYFNIEWADQGIILAVGWPGQWSALLARDEASGLRIRAGQERTHFVLHPGEEVRTPLMVLQFWRGNRIASQNVWRRWMRAHNLPRPGGKALRPQTAACSSHQFAEMIHANEENQKLFIDRYVEERLPLDYWWMDAGWYPNDPRYNPWGWPNTGTWEVDTQRFPNGLRPITDHGRAKGIRSIVWFEPERVTPGTWLWRNHQDWLLGPAAEPDQDVADTSKPRDKLLDLGNPEARQWLTDHVDRFLAEQGVNLYRQDFNTDPLDRWRMHDAEDRQGITEIRYVTGYLAYWDALRERHPDMLIDSCASGGRRNDLETLRRAVPLLRSDYLLEPVSQQNHTYGISLWYPFYGTAMTREGIYEARSCMCPHITFCYDMRERGYDYDRARRVAGEWQKAAAYMLDGDYYPLTPYSAHDDVWMAWQFDIPETGEGMVQAFRRADCIYRSADFRLNGLDPEKDYAVTDLDTNKTSIINGCELADKGLLVEITTCPGSALLVYKAAP